MRSSSRTSPAGDAIVRGLIVAALLVIAALCIYPVLYTFSVSISASVAVASNEVVLWPIGFSTTGYKLALEHPNFLQSYANSIFYTFVGTLYSLILTIFAAYVLARKGLIGRNFFMFMIAFTMLFHGGLIPYVLVVKDLGLLDTRAALIIPGAVAVYLLIIMRTVFQSMPESMEEAAKIDGAGDLRILFQIVIPLNRPVIATVALFYAVSRWNDFFSGLIFLTEKDLFPLQLIVRDLVVSMSDNFVKDAMQTREYGGMTPMGLRCAVIFLSMLPLLVTYPFLQKYFVKGVMIGAIKG
ncbi:carbohydrate ABC transporter permease [Paenibacillus cymbidii]|uniref:carbohydrate ABC transporter permease n=1 Tax=Paenibacillus cymbidii TaxID=1639034 RepID=UPI0010809F35|nr:carbohydrate ABC transporter permease [Paenibacillus cymbidii]